MTDNEIKESELERLWREYGRFTKQAYMEWKNLGN